MSRNRSEVDAALAAVAAGARAADLESPTLDFKEQKPSASDTDRMIAEAAVCFANSGGGTILIGIRDKVAGQAAFVGTTLSPERVQQRVYELTRPPLHVEVDRHPVHQDVLMVSVSQSVEIHADTQGRAFRRINRDCMPMSPQEQAMLREERHGIDFSAAASGRPIEDVSPEALAVARSMLARNPDERRNLARASDVDLLVRIGATAASKAEFNRAGAIMFCEPHVEDAAAIVYQYRATPGGEPRTAERIPAPLLLAFLRVMSLMEARISSKPLALPSGQVVSIEDFPLVAIRETLSNAICHRDLRAMVPVTIEHSPDLLRVTSPGPLVPGVTTNNIITTASRPRNPALARIARTLGIAEELGSGVDRMFRAMIGAGRMLPLIEDDPSRVSVTLAGGAPKTNVARVVAQLPPEERDDTDALLLLHYLCERRTITILEAATWLQRSETESRIVLRRLSSEPVALLEPTRQTALRTSPIYRLRSQIVQALGTALGYRRPAVDDIDRKVIAHVREYGKVTNNTLKNILDIDVYQARDILQNLAQRDILTRISEAKRGPGVEWGAGAAFPQDRRRSRKPT